MVKAIAPHFLLRVARVFFSELRARTGSKYWPLLFIAFVVLLVRKATKQGFASRRGPEAEESIDLVILTVSKDHSLLETMIESVRDNLYHRLNKIYVISRTEKPIIDFCAAKGFTFVDELQLLGYGKDQISYMVNGVDRSGWIFQQLLKLSGDRCVEMKRYLIVDSDTVFIQPHKFMEKDKIIFLQSTEWHQAYFESFRRIFGYEAPTNLSLTSHMMLFDVEHLAAMKREIEKRHGKKWDEVYINLARPDDLSCVSDYETYGNWVLHRHPEKILVQPLYNIALSRKHLTTPLELQKRFGRKCKSISFHAWMDESAA
jgi:hypothetical protein